jgi:2-polyprenyl-3-methyl-5-hydroxy-6-metoxy-1,4-benzoquinol methylase
LTTREKEHWEEVAQELDTYYREEKDVLGRAIDKVFRKAMTERLNLTLQECSNIKGKRVLNIGCGTGLMSVRLAQRGAYIVGIDYSQNMIEQANAIAKEKGLLDNCIFIKDDFAKHVFNGRFDISIALGFFDYTKDPELNIKKMNAVTKEKCIMSFSARFAFQVPLRMIWLRSRNRPIHLYTKKELKRLFSPIFSHYKIQNISAGYYCVGTPQAQTG